MFCVLFNYFLITSIKKMLCDHGCKYNKLKFFLYDLNIL